MRGNQENSATMMGHQASVSRVDTTQRTQRSTTKRISPPPTVPTLECISDYTGYWANHLPDAAAVSQDLPEYPILSYRELHALVENIAATLLARGVRRGERIAVLSTPRVEAFASFLATARIGAIWVGINPRHTIAEIARTLNDCEPSGMFTIACFEGRDFLADLSQVASELTVNLPWLVSLGGTDSPTPGPPLQPEFDSWQQFLAGASETGLEAVSEAAKVVHTQDPALIVYTSGSTGAPKGGVIRHSGLVRLGVVQAKAFGVPPQPRYLCSGPIDHIGLIGDICGVCLVNGGTNVFRERLHADSLTADIVAEHISVLFAVPVLLLWLLQVDFFKTADTSALKVVAWGGGSLPVVAVERLQGYGFDLATTYGSTEATISVTYSDLDASVETLATTVGRPDPEVDVRLLSTDGSWINVGQPGVTGEVCLRHPTTMFGYWRRPEATAAAYTAEGYLRMGDVGRFTEDGNLVLVGRTHDMYKSGGYNIYPRELEIVIDSHPDVQQSAVVPRPDSIYQEVGVCFVQAHPGHDLDLDELRKWARARLANYKVPKSFRILAALPTFTNQKVDRNRLRQMAHE